MAAESVEKICTVRNKMGLHARPAAKIATTGPLPVLATRAAVGPRVFLAIAVLRAGVRVKAATPETKRAIRPASSNDIAQDTVPCARLSPRRRSPASRTTAYPPMNAETTAPAAPQK